jgi:hypothetical protein
VLDCTRVLAVPPNDGLASAGRALPRGEVSRRL